jgi:hypothetical protein
VPVRSIQVPTLDAPDHIFVWQFLSLSLRQFALLLLAGIAAVNCWPLLAAFGNLLQWCAVLLLVLLALAFGWVRVYGHPLEYVLVIMLRYYLRPRLVVFDQREEER